MRRVGVVLGVVLLAGCSTASTDYYQAVEKAAQANAIAAQAKFDALSRIAAAGDGQAASAAVMALALTQNPTITPIPQQSAALQWASVLAAPVSNLGMMWMQTDSTKAMAKYNAQVDLARISADATTQQALYGSFVDTASAGYDALGNIDYTPFVDGMVTLGTAGIDGAVDLGVAGFDANTDIATVGLNTAGQLGVTGMDNLTNLGAAGFAGLVGLGTEAIDGMITLDTGNNALYSSVWSSYTKSLENMLDAIPDPVTCTVTTAADGAATVTCN